MKKGERLVAGSPSTRFRMPTSSRWILPFAPPPEVQSNNLNTEQEAELARLLGAPKVAAQGAASRTRAAIR